MTSPTVGWEKVDHSYYRKIKLYDTLFDPNLDLANHVVAGALYSGAVALYRDQNKLHTYRNNQPPQHGIDIYSCSGSLLRHFNWDRGPISGFGWSVDEELIVVSQDGVVRVYRDLQADFSEFTLGNGAEDHGVIACRFWAEGLVALLGNHILVWIADYAEPRPRSLASPPAGPIHSWTLVPPSESLSRSVEVILALQNTIFVVDANDAEDRLLPNGPFRHIVASPNGMYLALYTDAGKVWIITVDFQQKLGEYEVKTKTQPADVQWCGNDSVLISWEDEVQLIGPNGSTISYFYDDWVHILPDVDGVRFLTNSVCDFLQRVPDASEEVFRIGSVSPSSVLLDAVQQLEKKSPKADESIQLIRPDLPDAVAMCVEAAGQQHSITWQRLLLKAASFGKSVLDLYGSDDFVEMCQVLRILNSIRDFKVGLPMTYEQYKCMGPRRVVRRLIRRRHYLLAIHICELLKLPTNTIYVHWATQKVRSSEAEDHGICNAVVARLGQRRGISFEVVARAAHEEGRTSLATQLLNHESRPGKQVPLLLSMSKDDVALDKALASGDADLIYSVLLHLKKTLPIASFFRTLTDRPLAAALVEFSARDTDRSLLKDMYYQDDRRLDSANLLFAESLQQNVPQTKIDKVKLASKILADHSKDADAALTLKFFQESQALVRLQSTFDDESSQTRSTKYTGLSLNQTIYELLLQSQSKRAQKLSQEFRMGPRSWEWIRLRALVSSRRWDELEDIAHKLKKSAIGWESYFNEILSAGNTKLAGGTFVSKCVGLTPRERSAMWAKCRMLQEAASELVKAKDFNGLDDLRKQAKPDEKAEIERMMSGLRIKK